MRHEDYGVWKQKVQKALALYDMFGAKQAAHMCNVHVTTIYQWRREAAKHCIKTVPLRGHRGIGVTSTPRRTDVAHRRET